MAQRPFEVLKKRWIGFDETLDFLDKSILSLNAVASGKAIQKSPCPPHKLLALKQLSAALSTYDGGRSGSKSGSSPKVFRKVQARGLAQLMPLHQNNAQMGVRLFLSNFLFGFVPELEGIFVSFRKVRATDDKAFSYDAEGLGILVFKIDLEILVFSPRAGTILKTSLTEVRPDGLEGLLFKTWIVNVPKERWLPEATYLDDIGGTELPSSSSRTASPEQASGTAQDAPASVSGDAQEGKGARLEISDKVSGKTQIIRKKATIKFIVVKLDLSCDVGIKAVEGSMKPLNIRKPPKS